MKAFQRLCYFIYLDLESAHNMGTTATATIKSNGSGRAEVDFMASAVNRNG